MVEFKIVEDPEYPFAIGLLPREQALTFADHLVSLGIKAVARPGPGVSYEILIAEEKYVQKAKLELLRFGSNPFGRAYNDKSWARGAVPHPEHELRPRGEWLTRFSLLSFTTAAEVIAVLVFVLAFFNERLIYGTLVLTPEHGLSDPLNLYRLVTPVFLHFNLLHIAFNLVMWEAFARPLERTLGTLRLIGIFLTVAVISNYLQYQFLGGANAIFGGMSGVVYGVIGYMGVLSRRPDLPPALRIPPGLFTVSVIFIAIGFFLDGIANLCHLGGLLIGILWGLRDLRRPLGGRRI